MCPLLPVQKMVENIDNPFGGAYLVDCCVVIQHLGLICQRDLGLSVLFSDEKPHWLQMIIRTICVIMLPPEFQIGDPLHLLLQNLNILQLLELFQKDREILLLVFQLYVICDLLILCLLVHSGENELFEFRDESVIEVGLGELVLVFLVPYCLPVQFEKRDLILEFVASSFHEGVGLSDFVEEVGRVFLYLQVLELLHL